MDKETTRSKVAREGYTDASVDKNTSIKLQEDNEEEDDDRNNEKGMTDHD